MTDSLQTLTEQLRHSIVVLEAQRTVLGDAVVEPALAGLRQQLAGLEAQQQTQAVPEERRIVTILFSDIVGSTAMAEQLDPEDWRQVVAGIHAMAGRCVQQQDGVVVQYLGDGLLALFGARTSSERDPENSIRAALDIQAGIAALETDRPVQMRVGIHTGLVVVGEMGSEARREFTATGDAMNLAARLQSAAPPGGIIISRDTYRYVRGVFDVTPQPLLSVKGKAEPIQTYVVHRVKPRPFRTVTRGVVGLETRTVGREAEFNQLQRAYLSAIQDSKLVWAQLVGQPGVGKSRLLSDLLEYLALQPQEFGLLRARAFQGDERQAFELIRRAWFDLFQIAEDAPLAEAEAKWQDRFVGLRGAGFEEAAHALGLLVGLPFDTSPHIGAMRLDPAQVKGRAIVVSRELLASMLARTHLVILLEDLHWADASSWEYLEKVILEGGAGSHGVFVLATARPEWNPPEALRKYADYVQIDVASLSDAACHELVSDLLRPVEGVPGDVLQMMVERSEGVPYFAEEMVNWFLDLGIIDSIRDPWRFDPARLKELPLPATLQHLLLTRLSSLREAERMTLQRGSIFGRHFWERGLEALDVSSSGEVLRQLELRNLVHPQVESSLAGEMEWSFHHNLLHEVTYETVLKRDRKRFHHAAGAWLEVQARRAGRLDEFAGLLGEHAERAGEVSAAADWYLRAGERAKARGALLEARRFFERTLELVPLAERLKRWRALLGHNEVVLRLGDREAHRTSLSALRELAEELGDSQRAQAYYREGIYADIAGNYRAALLAYDKASEAAWRASDHGLGVLLLGCKVICQNRLGDSKGAAATAELLLSRAYEVDEATGAKALSNLAVYYVESGDLAKAALLHEEQASLNHRLGNRTAAANALANLGYAYVCLGMPEAARAPLEHSLELYRTIGARRELAYSRLNLGLAHWRSGDGCAAQQVLEQLQSELAVMGDVFAQAAGLSYLALAQEQSGQVAEARQCFAQAQALFNTIGVHSYAADACAGLARAALAEGQPDVARQQAAVVWAHLREHGPGGMEFPVRAYLTCAEVFGALGEPGTARIAVEEGYHELIQRADKISNLEWRKSFLENVPEHRAILDKWTQLAVSPASYSDTQRGG